MDPISNPYTPGAGIKPVTLAGRDGELKKAEILLKRVKAGLQQRPIMFYGLRGVGKTVLLNEIQELAIQERYYYEHLEISENDDFKVVIALVLRKLLLRLSTLEKAKDLGKKALGILKAFTFTIPDGPEISIDTDAIKGAADSGNFQLDLTALLENLGELAKETGDPVCLFFDEVQYLKEDEFGAIIAASHRISQRNLPVVTICAGLPQILAVSGDAKSYAERLFEFIPIENLDSKNAEKAIAGPAESKGVTFNSDALQEVISITEGYPYFIQELGKQAWDVAEQSPIILSDITGAKGMFEDSLDQSFFKVRLDRATEAEKKFMKTMAEIGKGPYKVADIASKMGRPAKSLGPTRAKLVNKGFIYPPAYGLIDFSVPQFDVFLRRHYNL
ncbi:AAA family ATPase [Paenibacillus xanthanilyticus]|uniref:AAA family ATPase n=1 Tax=Paenibacillus xanthanilyticus TaxID=1783531 RepID=A0ABV8KA90_9BACL